MMKVTLDEIRRRHAMFRDDNKDSPLIRYAMVWSSNEMDLALARIRELETWLAWYAGQDNYLGHCPAILSDRGLRAAAALSGGGT